MELAYVAGLFDGEGWVRIDVFTLPITETRPKAYRRMQLRVGIAMSHYPTIRALYGQFGGMISRNASANSKNRNHAINYAWVHWSSYAAGFLEQIRPFLITKREQAVLAIRFQKHIRRCDPIFRKHHGTPPSLPKIHAYRAKLIAELQRHKSGRFNVPKEMLKAPKQKWPYAG